MRRQSMEKFLAQERDWTQTLTEAIYTCKKVLKYTGVTVIPPAIIWYLFSGFKFQARVGFFFPLSWWAMCY
jgi:hypothetical protein